ncbi:hypothetical protein LX32DRAFT_595566 [Colletotrichum zoysiae]|uniref:Uncharacterized protein n=1 Tax=Colletotrichum zoysiae TaxID=1216348 RepID=A0AAD9HC28_9PEZI|nr:hypothetical protein LX32DRAFT_595566 [Colletotrichum zoysiae]
MSRHPDNCSSAAAYAERVFQQLEDNRPSDAPDDFSDPSPEEPTSGESKTKGDQPQPVRSNTVGSPDVYVQSKDGKSNLQRAGSVDHGHVQKLIASYEARSSRTEELALDVARREREVAAAGSRLPKASTPAIQHEPLFFCPACIADDEKEWIKAVEADMNS